MGNFLNRVLAHLIIRTTQRVSTGLTVSRKMPLTKPLGAKIDKLCSLVLSNINYKNYSDDNNGKILTVSRNLVKLLTEAITPLRPSIYITILNCLYAGIERSLRNSCKIHSSPTFTITF